MKNFFKKKKEPEDEFDIITQELPLSTIFRWYLYDTELVEDINNLAELVGLSRVSEEGETKEIEDSKARVKKISPLYTFLESISEISARVLTSIHLSEIVLEESPSDKELEFMGEEAFDVYKAVALSTLIGAFSIGLNMGIINSPTVGLHVVENEEFKDE